MTKNCKADFMDWAQKTWGTWWKPQEKIWPELQKEQMSLQCPVLLNFYTHNMFPDSILTLLSSLFSVCVLHCITNSRTRWRNSLLPHCVNDIHWCNIFFQWKGKLIIGSYRACDDPMSDDAECLGRVQDVLKAVYRERSLCRKWFLRHRKHIPSLPHHYKMLPSGFPVLLNLLLPIPMSLSFC